MPKLDLPLFLLVFCAASAAWSQDATQSRSSSSAIASPGSSPPGSASTSASLALGPITFAGGDGSSMEQAVVILGATNTVNGIRAELAWLREKHSGFKRKLQALSRHEGKYYDVLEVDLGDGRLAKFYFDISDFFGKH